MKIGILQSGHLPDALQSELGDYDALYPRMFDGFGFEFETWAVVDGDFPPGPQAADGWLVTGSRNGAYDDEDWIARLEEFIRDIRDSRRPLIGVCFGHQIIAQALGGKVEKFAGGWAVGRQVYQYGDRTVALNAWHQDQVTVLPPTARIEASNDFCAYAALSYGNSIWTIQPHPEFGPDELDGLLRTRGKLYLTEAEQEGARATINAPSDRMAIAADMAAFFRQDHSQ